MPDITTTLRVPRYSSAPGSPQTGQVYYNTTANILYWYNGTAWQAMSVTGTLPVGGTTGQILAKTSATDFAVAWKAGASAASGTGGVTAGTTSTSYIMAGRTAPGYTPQFSGKTTIMAGGTFYNNSTGGVQAALRYGTGTAPSHGAADQGTAIGPIAQRSTGYVANQTVPFHLNGITTLNVGTTYWVDIAYSQLGGTGTALLTQTYVCCFEWP